MENPAAGGKKQREKALQKAAQNHVEQVLRPQMRNNCKMFELDSSNGIVASESQIVSYMDSADNITDIPSLLKLEFEGHSLVRDVKNDCPFDGNIQIIDLKLDVYGPKEDFFYSTFPLLVRNVRRGNTILRVYDEKASKTSYYLARKGLQKFFDLRLGFVSRTERNGLSVDRYGCDLHQEKNYILAPVLKAIAQGHQVEVLKTLKANGENVQVSYSAETESWVVCSKNVAILVRNRDDVQKYENGPLKDRCSFACEMAYVWLDKIGTMEAAAQVQIKKDLSGRTMIGEYIGSQEHQHLVKYSRVTIIFYAIVDNYSADPCWPCSKAWAFFHKYGLDVVHIKSLGTFDNYGLLCDQLEQTFKDVAKSSIAQDEEGNVLYFIKKDRSGSESTLSLAKLKTLEYRLFRKMREKLRAFYNPEKDSTKPFDVKDKPKSKFDDLTKRFERESSELLEGGQNELPKPLAHYVRIFSSAFDFIAAQPEQVDVLQREYVTFSENLLKYIGQTNVGQDEAIDTSTFFFSGVLDSQADITYGQDVEMTDESQDGGNQAAQEELKNPEEEKASDVKPVSSVPKVIFIIPFAVPNAGKSFLWKSMQAILKSQPQPTSSSKVTWSFASASSDEIRAEETRKRVAQGQTYDQAFDKSRVPATKAYKSKMTQLIKSTWNLQQNCVHVIYLDKNHPPEASGAGAVAQFIDENMPSGVEYSKLYLIPKITQQKMPYSPFSYQFVAQCVHNSLNRTEHETLDNSDVPKAVAVLLMFLRMNSKQYDEQLLQEQGLSAYFTMPLTNEELVVPQDFQQAVDKAVQATPSRGLIASSDRNLLRLIDLAAKNGASFGQHPPAEVLKSTITSALSELLTSPKSWHTSGRQTYTPIKHEQQSNRNQNQMNQGKMQSNNQKAPVFLGISCEKHAIEIKAIIQNTFSVLAEELGTSNDYQKDLVAIQKALNGNTVGQWKMPNSYHVTQMFMAGQKHKQESAIYKNYQEGVQEKLTVCAVLYVPGRILTAVCFPKAPVENEFPHMTLMLGGKWTAKLSNSVLMATCKDANRFKSGYADSKAGNKEQFVQYTADVEIQVGRGSTERVDVVYVGFQPSHFVQLHGRTKKYY